MKIKYPLESFEQKAVIKWSSYHPIVGLYIYHPANGGSRHPIEAHNLKLQGVRKGVSDLHFPYPCNSYHSMWIEMKRQNPDLFGLQWNAIKLLPLSKSKLTEEQHHWLSSQQELGAHVAVGYGAEDAINKILNYIS